MAVSQTTRAATVAFDGNGVGSATLDTPANWNPNNLPTTTDQALFDRTTFGGALPSTLSNGTAQAWGNLTWNTNDSSTITGSAITLSAGAGTADFYTLGSNVTTGVLSIQTTSSALPSLASTSGNINVVNAGAKLSIGAQFNLNGANTITKIGAGTVLFNNGNNTGGGAGSKFVLDQGTLDFGSGSGGLGGLNNRGGVDASAANATTLEIHGGTALDAGSSGGFNASFAGSTVGGNGRNYKQIWAGDFTFKGTAHALNLGSGLVTLSNGSVQVTVTNNALTEEGIISDGGSSYGLTKAGSGNMTLTAANTYTGVTTVNGGTLQLNFSSTTGAVASPTNNIVNSSSGLRMGGGILLTSGAASTTNSQTMNGTSVQAGASGVTATSGSSGTMNVVLGTVTRSVGGTVNFILPTSGTIAVSNSADSLGLFLPGFTVSMNDWATISAGHVAAFTGYTVQNASNSWLANQNISTSGAVSGPLGADLTINSLRLNPGNNSATINLGGNTLTVLSGILVTGSTSQQQTISNGSLRGANGDLILINNNGSFSANTSQFLTVSANIVDNVTATALTVNAVKPIVLSGAANTYSGATYVNAGTLQAGVATTAFGNNSAVVISTGATLNLNGFDETIGSLASNNPGGTGSVSLAAGTLTTGGNNSSTIFGGVITGTGGLTKTGKGVLTLTGANLYGGSTAVNAGTLAVNGSLASGSNVTVGNTATLSGSGTINGAVTVNAGGRLSPGNDTGTLTVGGNVDVSAVAGNHVGSLVFTLGTVSDKVAVGGVLTLGTIDFADFVFDTNGTATAGTYVLFDGVAPIVGSIGTAAGTSGYITGTLSIDNAANDVLLTVTAVPEPAALSVVGVGGICLLSRRKRIRQGAWRSFAK